MSQDNREATILVVDDEPQILRALDAIFRTRGYRPILTATGEEGLRAAFASRPDVVVLDLSLPGMSGLDVLFALRQNFDVPVLVLTAADEESSKVAAFDLGADHYLTKPFSAAEIAARVASLVRRRRAGQSTPSQFEVGDIVVDVAHRVVRVKDRDVKLTRTEFDVLAYLAANAGRVVTSRALLAAVWGPAGGGDVQALRVHISNLRKKIEPVPSAPRYLLTEPGVGFTLVDA
jgi:two-component system, OmpR family, KDP operon response regulator KdpE